MLFLDPLNPNPPALPHDIAFPCVLVRHERRYVCGFFFRIQFIRATQLRGVRKLRYGIQNIYRAEGERGSKPLRAFKLVVVNSVISSHKPAVNAYIRLRDIQKSVVIQILQNSSVSARGNFRRGSVSRLPFRAR